MEEKKTTKTKKSTTKKVEEPKQQITMADIPPELLSQIIALAQSQMQQPQSKTEEAKVVKDEKPKKITRAYLTKMKDEEVTIRSVAGRINFISPKSGIHYKLMETGDVENMNVPDVLAMDSKSKRYLRTPWIIIEEDSDVATDVIDGLGLRDLYKVLGQIENIDEILEMDIYDIERLVEKLPLEYKEVLATNIIIKVNSKELKDYVLIKELERILNKSFI